MDKLLKDLFESSGISGYENEVAQIIKKELLKSCSDVKIDNFGNVIGKKGNGTKKIMIAAHMDEIGLVVKYINNEGFIYFVKVGGIADMVLPGQRVVIKAKKGDVIGVIGTKPPHLMSPEERNKTVTHDNMFIDIGCSSKEEALKKVELGDQIIFEPNAGVLNGDVYYGKAVDNRVACYAMIKIMEKLSNDINAQVYAVATAQEEVGLKGARTSSFAIAPDFALVVDTTVAGDVPGIDEKTSAFKIGKGVGITLIEASGRGTIVNSSVRETILSVAKEKKIDYQVAITEGGMTDAALIYMNREGILTGILSIPTRYLHASTSVFHKKDLDATIDLAVEVIKKMI